MSSEPYRLAPDGVKRSLRRRLMAFAPAFLVIAVLVSAARSTWPPRGEDIAAIVGVIGMCAIAIPFAYFKMQDQWLGYEVEIDGDRLRRRRPSVADQEWQLRDTTFIGWAAGGGDLVVRGPSKSQEIRVPVELDRFGELLGLLSQYQTPRPKPPIGAVLENLLYASAILGSFGGIFTATDPRLLICLGALGVGVVAWTAYGLLTHPNVAQQMRHHALHLIVPFLLCILTIIRAVQAWP